MIKQIKLLIDDLLKKVRLKPDTVAGKCRLQFGLAIILILALALLAPYYWMSKLTEKAPLDTGSAISELLLDGHIRNHDKLEEESIQGLFKNTVIGPQQPGQDKPIHWFRLEKEDTQDLSFLTSKQQNVLEELRKKGAPSGYSWLLKEHGIPYRYYMQIVHAEDRCISCHNPQGTALPFNAKEEVGAIIVRTPDSQTSNINLMNTVCVIFAGLLAGSGAIVAVYVIIQRLILRPIRQLRALVNNVSEGNLDARTNIKTDDEYQKLAEAFNTMLDGLEESQVKLRSANNQLDEKIVELSERNIELFKANKLKSEFLANMSHEFRTPLNAILGFADILREKPADDVEKSKRYAENIVKSGRSLLNMINDLLDLAKAEAGKMELHIEKTSVKELCNSLAVFFSPMTEKKMIKLKVSVQDDIPIINSDSGKIQQILYNFLSNSIKFTPEGGKIAVIASLLDEKTIRIAVTDTGCGIPQEQQEHIFEKFRQLDGSITRQGTGTGLGLAICKELANLLAAKISLESEVDNGSSFYLDLPIIAFEDDERVKKQPQKDD